MATVTVTITDEGDALRIVLSSDPPLPVGREEDATLAQKAAAGVIKWLSAQLEGEEEEVSRGPG